MLGAGKAPRMPTIRVNEIALHHEIHGSGTPVLLLHGLGSSARDWEHQVPVLAREFQVLTCDLRGHGRSDRPPGPYSPGLFAADVASLLRAVEVSPVHVVGLSLGGAVAFQLALDAPSLVRSLVIVNSAPEFIVRTARDRLRLFERLGFVRLLGMRAMGAVLSRKLFPNPEHALLRKTFRARFAQNDRRAYLDSLRALVGWSVIARLGEIACPTLIITSDHDYTPVAAKEAYAARIPLAQVKVIADARHAVPVERPEEFNAAVLEFIQAVDKETDPR
jgi:3-oxoadipate enol-lactonase